MELTLQEKRWIIDGLQLLDDKNLRYVQSLNSTIDELEDAVKKHHAIEALKKRIQEYK